jgi:hypothetical protein
MDGLSEAQPTSPFEWSIESRALDLSPRSTSPSARNHFEFANGSSQEAVGQVSTHWTFADETALPCYNEFLENSGADEIVGYEIRYSDHASLDSSSIFASPFAQSYPFGEGKHSRYDSPSPYEQDLHQSPASIIEVDAFEVPYLSAPFDYLTSRQARITRVARAATTMFRKSDTSFDDGRSASGQSEPTPTVLNTEREARRRQDWNMTFDFGVLADEEERQAERKRRKDFEEQIRRAEATMSGDRRGRISTTSIPGRRLSEERPIRPSVYRSFADSATYE